MACDQELCEHWTGHGCACEVFDIERVGTWTHPAPEPRDHPAVVDAEGDVWRWRDADEENDFDLPQWQRQSVRHYGAVVAGFTESDWEGLLLDYGPVRQATAAEAGTLRVELVGRPVSSDTESED